MHRTPKAFLSDYSPNIWYHNPAMTLSKGDLPYLQIKRLDPGDEVVLAFLAEHDAEFDVHGRSKPRKQLSPSAARQFLSTPCTLVWVALEGTTVIGFLFCILLPMRMEIEHELLLYEVGVHEKKRRQGVGRLLVAEMELWMKQNRVSEVWLLADNPGAEAFYRACGFSVDQNRPT